MLIRFKLEELYGDIFSLSSNSIELVVFI